MKDRVLSQLSGGFDSTASTLYVAESGVEFSCVFFNINQVYLKQERKAVAYIDKFLVEKYPNYIGLKEISCNLELGAPGEVDAYIPVRNMVLGSLSINYAIANGFNVIAVGNKTLEIREDDPYCFHDCSREFYTKMGDLGTFASQGKKIRFDMPLIQNGYSRTKRDVIQKIIDVKLDVKELWSCYADNAEPCGVCYHCQEVIETGFGKLLGYDLY